MESRQSSETAVVDIRSNVLEMVSKNPEEYDQRDVDRFKKEDLWAKRFWKHRQHDVNRAASMAIDCLKWRKKFEVNDITRETFPDWYFERGGVYPYTRDKNDCRILMLQIKLYRRDESNSLELHQKHSVYWMELMEREEKGSPISFLVDMTDAGLSHVDMEFAKFIITMLKDYYPSFLSKMYVFNMHWILTNTWYIIKPFLPSPALEKIQFVDNNTIKEFIEPKNLPTHMGGTDTSFQNLYPPTPNGSQDAVSATPKKKASETND